MQTEIMPDWNAMAEKFSVWLPHLLPASATILEAFKCLYDPSRDSTILDIATGTGEPALTLARHCPHAHITGIDVTDGMVKAATHRARQAGVENCCFTVMSAENLSFGNDVYDACVSRFGIMLFDNIIQGLAEIYRVLSPAGWLLATVWADKERMPTLQWAYQAFKDKIPDEALPPLRRATALGCRKTTQALLTQAGFTQIALQEYTLHYCFDSFDDYWALVMQSEIMQPQFEHLAANEHAGIKAGIASLAAPYEGEQGLLIPHAYTFIQAQKGAP